MILLKYYSLDSELKLKIGHNFTQMVKINIVFLNINLITSMYLRIKKFWRMI